MVIFQNLARTCMIRIQDLESRSAKFSKITIRGAKLLQYSYPVSTSAAILLSYHRDRYMQAVQHEKAHSELLDISLIYKKSFSRPRILCTRTNKKEDRLAMLHKRKIIFTLTVITSSFVRRLHLRSFFYRRSKLTCKTTTPPPPLSLHPYQPLVPTIGSWN